jgi:hypothetical protein
MNIGKRGGNIGIEEERRRGGRKEGEYKQKKRGGL